MDLRTVYYRALNKIPVTVQSLVVVERFINTIGLACFPTVRFEANVEDGAIQSSARSWEATDSSMLFPNKYLTFWRVPALCGKVKPSPVYIPETF